MSVPGPTLDSRTLAPTIVRFGTPYNSFTTPLVINFAASGDNTVVAAVASQVIRVYRIFFVVSGATNITIKDGASTSLTGAMTFNTGGAWVLDMSGDAWFTTASGNSFIINSSNAVQVSGAVYYAQA